MSPSPLLEQEYVPFRLDTPARWTLLPQREEYSSTLAVAPQSGSCAPYLELDDDPALSKEEEKSCCSAQAAVDY